MNNVRTIYADWYGGIVRTDGGPQLAYQNDHLSNLVIFDNAPTLPNYYLLVEMKTDDVGDTVALPAIKLEGTYWLIPNYYTQIVQTITFQVCTRTSSGDFEKHSAKFTGTILPTIKHDGEPIDQSSMFDPYIDILDKRVNKLIDDSGKLEVSDELATTAVHAWLEDHPEATTTVQDGAISEAKLATTLKPKIVNAYITPEMYGAIGDGVADDTNAIQSMFDAAKSGETICFSGAYFFSRVTIEKDGLNITDGNINGVFVLNANDLIFNSCTFGQELEIQWARGCVISKCLFNGDVGISVPATKTVTEHENHNSYGDPWFHSVARLSVTHCTFDVGTSSIQAHFDDAQQYGWMQCNDWIFSNNICRGVNAPSAEHDFYVQGIDGIRICENTFFTADSAANYQCPIVEIGRCDWLQIIGNNFFPATKEFIKLTDAKNAIVSNNHFTWQRYTNGVINSHPAISVECTITGQSITITNNNAYQITGNFVELQKAQNVIVWGEISGNSCYFRDRTGGITSGDCYIAYSDDDFKRINLHDNSAFGDLLNESGDEGHNVGVVDKDITGTLVSSDKGTLSNSLCVYNSKHVFFVFQFTPSEETPSYTVFVSGMPAPKNNLYCLSVTDSAGVTYPAFIDRNGFKLRLKSGVKAIFASGFYMR